MKHATLNDAKTVYDNSGVCEWFYDAGIDDADVIEWMYRNDASPAEAAKHFEVE